MDKNDNLQIGLAINHIAMSVDDETLETIKPWLNRIEEIVLRNTSVESEDAISRQAVVYYVMAHIHEIITESGRDKNEHTNRVLRAIMNGVKTMPSVTPKTDVLVEIRTEIEQLPTQTRTNWNGCCPDIDYPEIEYVDVTKHKLLSIIDKYRAESEDK